MIRTAVACVHQTMPASSGLAHAAAGAIGQLAYEPGGTHGYNLVLMVFGTDTEPYRYSCRCGTDSVCY